MALCYSQMCLLMARSGVEVECDDPALDERMKLVISLDGTPRGSRDYTPGRQGSGRWTGRM